MLDDIKQALEKATQGKWESTGTGVERDTGEPLSRGYVRIANLHGILHSNNPNHENDAHLIANAPEWLRWQNERIEELQKALEWYGDETNYEMVETQVNAYSTETTSATWTDSGERARTALQSIQGGESK